MKQTQKGNQWYFGMKAHIGVDSKTKLIHAVAASAANVHDKHALPHLLHGGERRGYGDTGYAGQKETSWQHAPPAKGLTPKNRRGDRYPSSGERPKKRTQKRGMATGGH